MLRSYPQDAQLESFPWIYQPALGSCDILSSPYSAAFDVAEPQVWQILASVLHMSNLEFDKMDSSEGEVASISDSEVGLRNFRDAKVYTPSHAL